MPQLPVTIIAPVWGQRHVARFLDIVAPSWLAPGNLPAMSRRGPVRVIFATCALDRPQFERSQIAGQIRRLATVDFVLIDDLLGPDHMPVTLTLAFQRALNEAARAGLPCACITLNADFLLADGALGNVARRLDAGERLILAPSLRVTEERALPILRAAANADGVIAIAPRALVTIALNHLHHTVSSCRMDQTALHSITPHQLYWRVDSQTLLSRAHCLFTLAVRLDGPPPPAQTYCDYGMGALLTGGARPSIMDDSDDFLAIELGRAKQETDFARLGPPSPAQVAQRLSLWTTDFHRAQAGHALVFHAAALPAAIDGFITNSGRVVQAVHKALGPPLPLLGHPIWRDGLKAWRELRADAGIVDDPPELAHEPADKQPGWRGDGLEPPVSPGVRGLVRRSLVGGDKARGFTQPLWRLSQALDRLAVHARAAGMRIDAGNATGVLGLNLGRRHGQGAPEGPRWRLLAVDMLHAGRLADAIDHVRAEGETGERISLVLHRSDGGAIDALDIARVLQTGHTALAFDTTDFIPVGADIAARQVYGELADCIGTASPVRALSMLARAVSAWTRLVLDHALKGSTGPVGQRASVQFAILSATVTTRHSDAAAAPLALPSPSSTTRANDDR